MPDPADSDRAARGEPLLEVDSLEAGYRAVQVLWGFSLEIYAQEVIA